MTKLEAKRIAHTFLCKSLKLELCENLLGGLYGFKKSEMIVFRVSPLPHESIGVGGSIYISVSKKTGEASNLGFLGE